MRARQLDGRRHPWRATSSGAVQRRAPSRPSTTRGGERDRGRRRRASQRRRRGRRPRARPGPGTPGPRTRRCSAAALRRASSTLPAGEATSVAVRSTQSPGRRCRPAAIDERFGPGQLHRGGRDVAVVGRGRGEGEHRRDRGSRTCGSSARSAIARSSSQGDVAVGRSRGGRSLRPIASSTRRIDMVGRGVPDAAGDAQRVDGSSGERVAERPDALERDPRARVGAHRDRGVADDRVVVVPAARTGRCPGR